MPYGRAASAALLLLVLPLAASIEAQPQPQTPAQACAAHEMQGLGLACAAGGLLRLFAPDGRLVATTHGPDAARGSASLDAEEQLAATPPRDPLCVASPPAASDRYFALVYAHPSKTPDRTATMAPELVEMVRLVNGFLTAQALLHARFADARFLCVDGEVAVLTLHLRRPASTDTPSTVFDEIDAFFGFDPHVKPVVWYDGVESACGCSGIAGLMADHTLSVDNQHNGPDFMPWPLASIIYGETGAAGAFTMLHEMGHTMGAVQASAPNVSDSAGGHCNDGLDIMCYPDGGDQSAYDGTVCAALAFDCNNDDFFHPVAPDGHYLASHWNIGSTLNRFVTYAFAVDTDGDGVYDDTDGCADGAADWSSDPTTDVDGDGCRDADEDLDDDGDDVPDVADVCPSTADAQQTDTDGDTLGDACDEDDDNDGHADVDDTCPTLASDDLADFNGDGFGDICQPVVVTRADRDGDGMPNRPRKAVPLLGITFLPADNCARVFNAAQRNLDLDRIGDACDGDADGDGVRDDRDTCGPAEAAPYNPLNRDFDGDGLGDACDADDDGDGVDDLDDVCPFHVDPEQQDADADGWGDACQPTPGAKDDRDQDGIPDRRIDASGRKATFDLCPRAFDPRQPNHDHDRQGDACDRDDDNDRVPDAKEPGAAHDHARLPYL